jgi:hypothetical protein
VPKDHGPRGAAQVPENYSGRGKICKGLSPAVFCGLDFLGALEFRRDAPHSRKISAIDSTTPPRKLYSWIHE